MLVWNELWAEMKRLEESGSEKWVQTSSEMYHEMLNVLPPRFWQDTLFLVGEAHHDNQEGKTVYAGFVKKDGKFFARYLTVEQAQQIAGGTPASRA